MSRKSWRLSIAFGLLLLPLIAALVVTRPQTVTGSPAESPSDQIVQGSYVWSYAAKFVCGFQPLQTSLGEPPVKPGNYATEINIHNPNYRFSAAAPLPIRKKVILLVDRGQVVGREPEAQQPKVVTTTVIGPDFAMMDDCNAIWQMLGIAPAPPPAASLTIGYLVVLSPLDLDIDAVYTAEVPGTQGTTPTGISIDVEHITGKRVFIPLNTFP